MRLSFYSFLFVFLFACNSTPNSDVVSEVQKETDTSLLQREKKKRDNATFSVDEIREPDPPSSLPGFEQVAVKERIRAPFSVYKEGTYTVISPDGLRMRHEPSLTADVVGKIPYLGLVSIVDIHNVVKDTLNKSEKYIGYSHAYFDKNISGDWVKVNYEGNEAYVFSAYLSFGVPNWRRPNWTNKDYAINSISKDCILEVHENLEMNWYGVFKKEDGFFMEPVRMSYRILHEENIVSNCIVNATPNKGLSLCFGTMKEMNTQRLDISASYIKLEYDSIYQPKFAKLKASSQQKLTDLGLDIRKAKGDGFELILSEGEIQQFLGYSHCWPDYIYLAGDIDQDGKMDYYVNYISHDSLGDAILYLSSEAKEGEIVNAVAINETGYCDF